MSKVKNIKIFRKPIFWVLFIPFLIAFIIIAFGDTLSDTLAPLSLRLLIGFSIFFGTLMAILIYKLYLKEGVGLRWFHRRKLTLREQEIADIVEVNVNELKSRFHEANKIIKNSSIYKEKKDATYELPWYLIIGSENEGKTSLLEASGLDFPLNINYQRTDSVDSGIDRSFKWYFAEESVFVDVSGKYIQQEHNSIESGIWKAFLTLFRKKRWKRPINGIIFTLSAETLLKKSDPDLEQYAKELRDRFDELSNAFASTIPIYFFITKTDTITGFREYFSMISEYEKDEILGMMFDDDKNIDEIILQNEFEAFIRRLESSILDRIHHEWDNHSRMKVLMFSDELGVLYRKLKLFINTGFTQTRYRVPLMLRGVYLSSAVPDETLDKHPKNTPFKGLFITKVLKEIIFPEANIIKMDSNHRQREKGREKRSIVIAAAIVLLFVGFWVFDYYRHAAMIDNIETEVQRVIGKNSLQPLNNIDAQLNQLNQLYALSKIDDGSFNYFWNIAFFKGQERQEKLETLYYLSLEQIILPRVAQTLETQMVANLSNYDATWENTKAYLMLNNEAKRDPQFLKERMKRIWNLRYPKNPSMQRQLIEHWDRLLEHGFRPYPLNMEMVKIARNKLAGFGKEVLLYKQLKDKAHEMGLKNFRFQHVLGSNAPMFTGSSYEIPGFFTKEGYDAIIADDPKELLEQLMRSNWVLGYDTQLSDGELEILFQKVKGFYFRDYQLYWNHALNALYVRETASAPEISEQMKLLSSVDSPILAILKGLKYHTEFYTQSESITLQAQEKLSSARINALLDKLHSDENPLRSQSGAHTVRTFFKPFHQLITSDGRASQTLQSEMDRLSKASNETTGLESSGSPQDAFNMITSRVNGQNRSLSSGSSSLPSPVSRWLARSLGNNWGQVLSQGKNHINEYYMSQVYPYYRDKLANKYPFNPSASTDVSLSDFEEFFASGGIIDQFQTQYISPFVTFSPTGRGYQYKPIDGAVMKFDPALMEALYLAREIRRSFFDGRGNSLGNALFIKPHILGRNLATAELEYDDSTIIYEHGPIKSKKLMWPALSGNVNAKLQLFNLENTPVYSMNNEGDWALFKLFSRMKTSSAGSEGVLCELNANGYRSSFIINGPASKGIGVISPMRHFKLKERL